MVNKVDRPAARPDWVVDQTFELFLDLGASDEQCGEGGKGGKGGGRAGGRARGRAGEAVH